MTEARQLTFEGRTQTITDWANELGISRKMIAKRLERGWDDESALTIPAGEDRELILEEGDPQCLANLAISLNASVLQRIEDNMPAIHAWIDDACKNDPEKAIKLADKLSAVFDRFAKHTAKAQQVEKALVNISLNSTARPDIVIDGIRGDVDG